LCHLIFSLNCTIQKVREHIADSDEIQADLKGEMQERFGELRRHRTAGWLYKCAAFMMVYMPGVVNGMLVVRRGYTPKLCIDKQQCPITYWKFIPNIPDEDNK